MAAVNALKDLAEKVPGAKGAMFALMDWGIGGKYPDTARASAMALRSLTGKAFRTPGEYQDWWASSWKTFTGPSKND